MDFKEGEITDLSPAGGNELVVGEKEVGGRGVRGGAQFPTNKVMWMAVWWQDGVIDVQG